MPEPERKEVVLDPDGWTATLGASTSRWSRATCTDEALSLVIERGDTSAGLTPRAVFTASSLAMRGSLTSTAFAIVADGVWVSSSATRTTRIAVCDLGVSRGLFQLPSAYCLWREIQKQDGGIQNFVLGLKTRVFERE